MSHVISYYASFPPSTSTFIQSKKYRAPFNQESLAWSIDKYISTELASSVAPNKTNIEREHLLFIYYWTKPHTITDLYITSTAGGCCFVWTVRRNHIVTYISKNGNLWATHISLEDVACELNYYGKRTSAGDFVSRAPSRSLLAVSRCGDIYVLEVYDYYQNNISYFYFCICFKHFFTSGYCSCIRLMYANQRIFIYIFW